MAAKRAGIKQVIVPKRNEKDLPDIPDEVRETLKFHFVENIDDVLRIALGAARDKAKTKSPGGRRPASDVNGGSRNGASRHEKTRPAAPRRRRAASSKG